MCFHSRLAVKWLESKSLCNGMEYCQINCVRTHLPLFGHFFFMYPSKANRPKEEKKQERKTKKIWYEPTKPLLSLGTQIICKHHISMPVPVSIPRPIIIICIHMLNALSLSLINKGTKRNNIYFDQTSWQQNSEHYSHTIHTIHTIPQYKFSFRLSAPSFVFINNTSR